MGNFKNRSFPVIWAVAGTGQDLFSNRTYVLIYSIQHTEGFGEWQESKRQQSTGDIGAIPASLDAGVIAIGQAPKRVKPVGGREQMRDF